MADLSDDKETVTCPACYWVYIYDMETHKPDDCPNCGYSIYVSRPKKDD